MEYARMASGLLVRLRREMNGAVVADMESRGLHYRRNYGVSLHTVRQAAREFAPDHDFAKYLWQQPIRELKLAAVAVADPGAVTTEELSFWFGGVENSELAENLASFLLARTIHVKCILETFRNADNPYVIYAALLTAVRGYPAGFPATKIIKTIEQTTTGHPSVERAAALLLSRAGNESDENRAAILDYAEKLRNSDNDILRRISDEIMI